MIGSLARAFAGFVLACLTAGLIQTLFLPTTYDLASSTNTIFPGSLVVERMFLITTHAAIFATAFALIAAGIGEWMGIRSLPYYVLAGTAIALLGLIAQFSSEVPGQPTIFNTYALAAFLTSGFFAGLVYWHFAGRHAHSAATENAETIADSSPKSWKTRPRIVVEDNPTTTVSEIKTVRRSLSQQIADAAEAAPPAKPGPKPDPETETAAKANPAATSVPSTKPAADTSEETANKADPGLKSEKPPGA